MASDPFRHQLFQEAVLWQAEGLITPAQYELLAERYQFHSLESSDRDRFITILIGVGSILLGLGVITFVAANWQAWPRTVKLGLLLGLFLVVNGVGFYYWQQPHRKQHRLGHGLLLLGALILGANLALMAQLFHISGDGATFFFVWGFGVVVMAYSLQLPSLAVLSLLLVGMGYLQGMTGLATPAEASWQRLGIEHMPLLASVVFVPLAYRCQLPVLFTLTVLLVTVALEVNFGVVATSFSDVPGWIAALSVLLPPALLWSFDDTLWPGVHSRRFRFLARELALLFLCVSCYVLSFHFFWDRQGFRNMGDSASHPWGLLIDAFLLMGLALYQWLRLIHRRREISRSDWVVASVSGIAALTLGWHFSVFPLPVLGTVIVNGLLFLLASSLTYDGVTTGHRQTFWLGILLLTLQILSRLLEFETGLLLKSLVFSLCGISVMIAGLWFERHLSKVKPSQEEA